MAISVVHESSSYVSTPANPVTYQIATTTTGNALIVVVMSVDDPQGTVSSISISPGSGTFTKVIAQAGLSGDSGSVEIWWCDNITGGTTPTLTVTFNGTNSMVIGAFEVSGLGTATDGSNGTGPTSGTTITTPAFTTTNAADLLVGGCNVGNSFSSADATYTTDSSNSAGNPFSYKIVSATGSQTYSVTTTSGFNTIALAAFKGSGGATDINATIGLTPATILTIATQLSEQAVIAFSPATVLTIASKLTQQDAINIQPATVLLLGALVQEDAVMAGTISNTLGLTPDIQGQTLLPVAAIASATIATLHSSNVHSPTIYI